MYFWNCSVFCKIRNCLWMHLIKDRFVQRLSFYFTALHKILTFIAHFYRICLHFISILNIVQLFKKQIALRVKNINFKNKFFTFYRYCQFTWPEPTFRNPIGMWQYIYVIFSLSDFLLYTWPKHAEGLFGAFSMQQSGKQIGNWHQHDRWN